jgi:DnaJ-class molecular chaperone
MGFGTTPHRCRTCGGNGVVVTTDKKTGEKTTGTCPECKGNKQSTGIVKK